MKNGRRKFLGEERMVILRRHLVDKVAVSDVCDGAGISPTLFYRWQKELADKDEVIGEIMESHVRLKKSLGET